MMAIPIRLEICVESLDHALAAESGGADRIELCHDLSCGGVTPNAELIRAVRHQVAWHGRFASPNLVLKPSLARISPPPSHARGRLHVRPRPLARGRGFFVCPGPGRVNPRRTPASAGSSFARPPDLLRRARSPTSLGKAPLPCCRPAPPYSLSRRCGS